MSEEKDKVVPLEAHPTTTIDLPAAPQADVRIVPGEAGGLEVHLLDGRIFVNCLHAELSWSAEKRSYNLNLFRKDEAGLTFIAAEVRV